jgi:drug/metabolite transporter (DMT)-like permease
MTDEAVRGPGSSPIAPAQHGHLTPFLWACVAATWLVWGSTYLVIKYALVSFPPFFQMSCRFLAAGGLLMAWMLWRRAPWPTARQWLHALIAGTLMLGGGMGCTALAEETIGSGLVVVFIAVVPMMIATVNLFFGVKPARREVGGICVGLIGVVMLTQGSGFQSSPQGLIAITVACLTWSVGSSLTLFKLPLAPGAMGYASEMLCGGGVMLLISWLMGERPHWPPQPSAVLALIYLVVFGSLIAFNAYMVLINRVSTGLASSYTFVNPVIAIALGVFIGGETISPQEWVAVGVVLCGVLLLMRPPRP